MSSAQFGALAGKTIVVTRPLAQAKDLADAIEAAGGHPLIFPLLEILPVDDTRELDAAIRHLDTAALAIFISPNAVDHALTAILKERPWPDNIQAAAVGPGSVKTLAAHGILNCLLPAERFDSEALLTLPEFAAAQVSGKHVMIFRGDSGRELLADTLRERGARVECVTCYQRRGPGQDFSPLSAAWAGSRLDAIALSSSEALRHLVSGIDVGDRAHLAATPVFVPHARIAETAHSLGLKTVILTPPADAGLLAGLCAYNWPKHSRREPC